MLTCPGCSEPVADSAHFCPACGTAVKMDQPLPTAAYQARVAAPPSPPDVGEGATGARFQPGEVLAGRYRVVAFLGKGGMGEVYRADDMTLGQPVALKFLPAHFVRDPDRLTRFRKEVAAARKASHPNVCRVYDIAEHGGQPFLSMEFIDGEDLASVLRRFGRLPEERAIEAARQLCAALAAVHEQGFLHRDLKPANVMFDGRGKVRLTDFGLAAAGQDIAAGEIRSGTPMYMAPEQLAGQEVSVRSDLFALGLVLYELFTGKRAFAAADRDELALKYAQETPSKPTSHVSGLSAAVERVILRCLERDPAARPRSAYEVLAALPGGDPLAAALAAGETPSPQLVADAGGEGSISPRLAAALLGVVALSIFVVFVTAGRATLYGQVPLPHPPAEMGRDARKMLTDLGFPDKPVDWVGAYSADLDSFAEIIRIGPGWDQKVRDGTFPTICYFYREALQPLAPGVSPPPGMPGFVSWDNPPRVLPGMVGLRIDPRGHLLEMYAIPPRHDTSESSPTGGDWQVGLFAAAGLDYAQFKDKRATPQWNPPCVCDEHYAWTGVAPKHADVDLRVEAAAYRGKPVYFQVIGPWTTDKRMTDEPARVPAAVVFVVVSVTAVLLGVRNLLRRRADLRGAAHFIGAFSAWMVTIWLLYGHHNLSVDAELTQLIAIFGFACYIALQSGFFYLALEPAVRRRWPWQFTAWNRLLAGRWRDPMVGRDLLLGLALGSTLYALAEAARVFSEWTGYPAFLPNGNSGGASPALVFPLDASLILQFTAIWNTGICLMIAFLLNLVLRRAWATWVGFVLLSVAVLAGPQLIDLNYSTALPAAVFAMVLVGTAILLSRFGFLAAVSYAVGMNLLILFPLTLDTSAWYFWQGLCAAAVLLALAGFGFMTATRGQPLFAGGFLGDD
jgi:predicted Ser/Thr protein kinase